MNAKFVKKLDDIFIGTLTFALALDHYNRFPVEMNISKLRELCPGTIYWHPSTQEQNTQNRLIVESVGKKVRLGEIPRFVWVDKFVNDFSGTMKELKQISDKQTSDEWSNLSKAFERLNNPPIVKELITTRIPDLSELEGLYMETSCPVDSVRTHVNSQEPSDLRTHDSLSDSKIVQSDESNESDSESVETEGQSKSVITTESNEEDEYIAVETIKEAERLICKIRNICEQEGSSHKTLGLDIPLEKINDFSGRISSLNCGWCCKNSPYPTRFWLQVYVYPIGKLEMIDAWLKNAVLEARMKDETVAQFDIIVNSMQKLFICKKLLDLGCEIEGIPHHLEAIRARKILEPTHKDTCWQTFIKYLHN